MFTSTKEIASDGRAGDFFSSPHRFMGQIVWLLALRSSTVLYKVLLLVHVQVQVQQEVRYCTVRTVPRGYKYKYSTTCSTVVVLYLYKYSSAVGYYSVQKL